MMINRTPFLKRCIAVFLFVNAVAHAFANADVADFPSPQPCLSCAGQILQGATWNCVLRSPPALSVMANIYDIDGFDNTAKKVALIHQRNAKAICYIDAGTWESWRPDAAIFPDVIQGNSNGWPGEKWLDIRQTSVLLPIMQARIAMCKEKGFDAIDFDNVDGYTNKTGFPLTSADQLRYNILLANMAHQAGFAVGLKNDLTQIKQLVPYFDFAVNEQCFEYQECHYLMPFIDANKPVLNIEYNLAPNQFCPQANAMNFNSIKKDIHLEEQPIQFCN